MTIPAEKPTSRQIYQRRISQVLDYVDQHLVEKLDLVDLARVAAFSPFHFHRVFKAIMDETVNGYVNRQRLERAAFKLCYSPSLPITTIALDCGFSTPANFARAFKLHFGVSASDYRKSKISQANRNPREAALTVQVQDRCVITQTGNWVRMGHGQQVEIRTLPGFHLAYARSFGAYDGPGIYAAWDQIASWAFSKDLATENAVFVGVVRDDPEITPASRCRYDACLVVGADVVPSGNIGVTDLAGGTYAIWATERRADEIGAGWEIFICNWLPDSGFEPDASPCFELYPSGMQTTDGRYRVDYCIPVHALHL